MAEELQGLLEKIHDETIKKADSEKNMIVTAAKLQAEKIMEKAKAEAEAMHKRAEQDAAEINSRSAAALKQAARDIQLELKSELEHRLQNVVKNCAGMAMTGEFMQQIILELARRFNPDKNCGVNVILAKKELDGMEQALRTTLLENFKSEPEFFAARNFSAGMQISFKGSDMFLDFSDEALAEFLCGYLGPRLSALLKA